MSNEKEVKVKGSFVDSAMEWYNIYQACSVNGLVSKGEYPSIEEMKKRLEIWQSKNSTKQ